MTTNDRLMEIAEHLAELDPVATYAQRGATLIANMLGASSFRLERQGRDALSSEWDSPGDKPTMSLPLRHGELTVGTLHLGTGDNTPSANQLALINWASRGYARGLDYAARLSEQASRKPGEAVAQSLRRAPLTPRERDVVSRLICGSSTRDIASQTGLTVSTVNTYLKRIFSKLGVHSRVELIARMAGTAGFMPSARFEQTHPD